MNRAIFSIPSLIASQTGAIAEVVGILGYPGDEPEIPSFSHGLCRETRHKMPQNEAIL
jgi:hypothetical protein